ncbi:MAG: helix-turn-helix transcriptional regulator, partial [Clostridia bacterium]|nr:helix-turn-helix transcriptional regulator [Clostridia bacterium]
MNELERMNILRLSNAEANKVTRECMKTALVKLLNEKDLPRISVTEIVTAAGVSRPAFYRNYSSKEDLLEDVIASVKELLSKVVMLWRAAETPSEKMEWMTQAFTEAGKNSVELGWLINIGH